jgi:hypothetical protein
VAVTLYDATGTPSVMQIPKEHEPKLMTLLVSTSREKKKD